MLGAVIGDIVGSIYEFDNIRTKDFPLFGRGCTFTDDSIMTLAVAKSLKEAGSVRDEETLKAAFTMKHRLRGKSYLGIVPPYPQK